MYSVKLVFEETQILTLNFLEIKNDGRDEYILNVEIVTVPCIKMLLLWQQPNTIEQRPKGPVCNI